MKKSFAPNIIKFFLDKNKKYDISLKYVFLVSLIIALAQIPLFKASYTMFPTAFLPKKYTAYKQGIYLTLGYFFYFRKLKSYLVVIMRRTACLTDAVKLLP